MHPSTHHGLGHTEDTLRPRPYLRRHHQESMPELLITNFGVRFSPKNARCPPAVQAVILRGLDEPMTPLFVQQVALLLSQRMGP